MSYFLRFFEKFGFFVVKFYKVKKFAKDVHKTLKVTFWKAFDHTIKKFENILQILIINMDIICKVSLQNLCNLLSNRLSKKLEIIKIWQLFSQFLGFIFKIYFITKTRFCNKCIYILPVTSSCFYLYFSSNQNLISHGVGFRIHAFRSDTVTLLGKDL